MFIPRFPSGYALAPFVGLLGLTFCTVAAGTVASIHILAGQPGAAAVAVLFCLGSAVGAVVLMRRQP